MVFNSPGANANAVKEMVVAGLLLASRRIAEGVAWCKSIAGEPDLEAKVEKGKKQFAGPELAGKTLGVVGLGAIGVLVANMGIALGLSLIHISANCRPTPPRSPRSSARTWPPPSRSRSAAR